MIDDTSPNLLGKSLEITLQDSLDSLEDFTLKMAYVTTGAQFEIFFIGDATDATDDENDLPAKPAPLSLTTMTIINSF